MIREINENDIDGLLTLYTHLHGNAVPKKNAGLTALFDRILADDCHHIIVAEEDGRLASSCVIVIIPNLTHGQRPYAVVENVITAPEYRRRGLASECLNYARDIAKSCGCYKIMLMTGSREKSTLDFYRRAGYNSEDKTGFVQWLKP